MSEPKIKTYWILGPNGINIRATPEQAAILAAEEKAASLGQPSKRPATTLPAPPTKIQATAPGVGIAAAAGPLFPTRHATTATLGPLTLKQATEIATRTPPAGTANIDPRLILNLSGAFRNRENLWELIDDQFVRREIERLNISKINYGSQEETNLLNSVFINSYQPDPSSQYPLGRYGIIILSQAYNPPKELIKEYNDELSTGVFTQEMHTSIREAMSPDPDGIINHGILDINDYISQKTGLPEYRLAGGWYMDAQIVDISYNKTTGELIDGPIPISADLLAEYDAKTNTNTASRTAARKNAIENKLPITSKMLEPVTNITDLHLSIHTGNSDNQTHIKFKLKRRTADGVAPNPRRDFVEKDLVIKFALRDYRIKVHTFNNRYTTGNNTLLMPIIDQLIEKINAFGEPYATEPIRTDIVNAFRHFFDGLGEYITYFFYKQPVPTPFPMQKKTNTTSSIRKAYDTDILNYNKYLKYKTKYLQLKAQMDKIKK